MNRRINPINQLDYEELQYPTTLNENEEIQKPYPSFAKTGCGICCACMMVERLTGKTITVEQGIQLSIAAEANRFGTNMLRMGRKIAEEYGLQFISTDSTERMLECLRDGGCAIINVGRNCGLFSDGGHYILAFDVDGDSVSIIDPSYSMEKYEKEYRKGKVRMERDHIVASVRQVREECANRSPAYYLFSC